MRYRISRVANADLDAIWHHIATDSIDAAERVDDELHKAMFLLARMPGMGHAKAGVKDPRVRFWRVYSYLIAYRIERSTLIVMRVVHAARDLRKLFPKP
ncbi:MAG TPA: type II toxin-antitoxin system RelE/ParE family toxin [Tepidisphaeraceae bacterium]|nr:type II toxin-antitoxin system RelE/ParE family toxin [Tepidisphaeraceae bacterium]